jgi:hypothetical protein
MAIIGVALARNAETARKVILTFQCESSASVGDFVYLDSVVDEKVLVNTSNTVVSPTIGVIDSKPSAQLCEVMVVGLRGGYSGLLKGQKVFLSASGQATATKPTTGYLHVLGVAVSATEMIVLPNSIRTKLS